VVRATKDQLATMIGNSPLFKELLGGSDATFLSGILFLFLPALILVYALVLAESWARELDAGRFELLLGTPTPRWRVFLGAWGATCVALVLAPLVLWVVALVSIRGWGLQVAAGDTFAAFAGFLPLELLVAALVYLVAGRLSAGAITGAIGGLIALSFLADFLNPVLKLPGWLVGLSVFHQYGTPIVSGPRWGAWLALIALAAVFLALGLVRFTRADLARGS
jgi:ABC-2 type transport system permease protein